MAFWRSKQPLDPSLAATDQGSGSIDDYVGVLQPKNAKITLRLAASDPCQDELRALLDEDPEALATATPARTLQQEGKDEQIEVRIFSGRRVSGVVGRVPRGLEGVYDEAVRRLDNRGGPARIPVAIVETKHGLRLDLLIGQTR